MNGRRILPALLASAMLLAAENVARADIKIGVFGPMTGDAAGYGQSLREVVDLVYYHGRSVGEVARILGTCEATVKTRMFYARRRLAQLIRSETAPTLH